MTRPSQCAPHGGRDEVHMCCVFKCHGGTSIAILFNITIYRTSDAYCIPQYYIYYCVRTCTHVYMHVFSVQWFNYPTRRVEPHMYMYMYVPTYVQSGVVAMILKLIHTTDIMLGKVSIMYLT